MAYRVWKPDTKHANERKVTFVISGRLRQSVLQLMGLVSFHFATWVILACSPKIYVSRKIWSCSMLCTVATPNGIFLYTYW